MKGALMSDKSLENLVDDCEKGVPRKERGLGSHRRGRDGGGGAGGDHGG